MRLLWIPFVAALLFVACGVQQDSATTPTPPDPSSTPTATSTLTVTPTPECDEKCELMKTITPLPTSTTGPPAAAYPTGTRTGAADVDSILDAIETRDQQALARFIGLTRFPCEADRPVQPQPRRCPDGVAAGTLQSGFLITDVEGGYWRLDEAAMAARFFELEAERGWKLHAVYSFELAGTRDPYPPETDFFITFTWWHPQLGPVFDTLPIVDAHVTAIHFRNEGAHAAWDNPADPGWLLPRAR